MTIYYVRTDGSDSNAGTSDSSGGAWLTLSHAMATVAAGDIVMVRASAGNSLSYPNSGLDYTLSSFATPASGSDSAGFTKFIGYNGIPTIGCAGLAWYGTAYNWLENLYLVATANTFGTTFGIVNGDHLVVRDCTINLNNQTSCAAIITGVNGHISRCEIYGGTASVPSTSSGSYGVKCNSYGTVIEGVRFRYLPDSGAAMADGCQLRNSLIYGCAGDGVLLSAVPVIAGEVSSNTIDGNTGHGISITGTNAATWWSIKNNLITNHATSGKKGISVATSSSDKRKFAWGWNVLYGNDGDYGNVTADSTDQATDPLYTNASGGDFTPTETDLYGAGFPDVLLAGGSSYSYPGAIQPQIISGGGGGGSPLVGDGGLVG